MLDIVFNDETNEQDKENVPAFTHCPLCEKLCIISGAYGDKNKTDKLQKYGMYHTCWINVFTVPH